jgi:hypothetical protein
MSNSHIHAEHFHSNPRPRFGAGRTAEDDGHEADLLDDNPFAGRTESAFGAPHSPFGSSRAPSVSADAPEGSYEYALVQTAPNVVSEDVETTAPAVDVRLYWGRNLLSYSHLSPPRSFYVGEEQAQNLECDYFLPAEKLGSTRAPLVLASDAGVAAVLLPGATGTVELPGQPPMTIADAVAAGLAEPCVELNGAQQITLPLGASLRMDLGDLSFEIHGVKAGRKLTAAFGAAALATGSLMYIAVSFAGHVGVLLAMAMFMPPLGNTNDQVPNEEQRYFIQQHLDSAAEAESDARPTEQLADQDADDNEGGTGTRSIGEEGSMGNPTSNDQGKKFAIKGPADNADPRVARVAALHAAAEFGMVGLLNTGVGGDPDAPTAPWGAETSLGSDPLSARGNMWGDSPGDSFGAGGLGLSGIGEGGGGRGEGIGMGSVGTIGHGAGLGGGDGFGNGTGRFRRGHKVKSPNVRIGPTTVSGRLPPEVIQRIVRQNFGRFRLCYESGLRNNPNLQGRVSVRFIIGRDGRVSNVGGAGDLPDSGVVSCVTRAFYGLSFPSPDGGIVQVSYPIVFTPGG